MKYDKEIHMAFCAMRKAGLLARMNHMGSIAAAEDQMTADYQKFIETGKVKLGEVKGCAYFTAPDNNDRLNKRKFCISYGNIILDGGQEVGVGDKAVGEIVVECLKGVGIKTNWDENPDNRIEVDFTEVTK